MQINTTNTSNSKISASRFSSQAEAVKKSTPILNENGLGAISNLPAKLDQARPILGQTNPSEVSKLPAKLESARPAPGNRFGEIFNNLTNLRREVGSK